MNHFLFQLEDPAMTLEGMRQLRHIASSGQQDAVFELCRLYVTGHCGGITQEEAAARVTRFIQSSEPTHLDCIFKRSELSPSMR